MPSRLQTCNFRQQFQQLRKTIRGEMSLRKLALHFPKYLTDRRRRSSEGKLEEPGNEISASSKPIKEEATSTNETLLGRICSAVGEGITNRPVNIGEALVFDTQVGDRK